LREEQDFLTNSYFGYNESICNYNGERV
jgi:hypothetical protein